MNCCEWMRKSLEHMNMNGLTVVPRKRFGASTFVVRFRSVDPLLWSQLDIQLPSGTPFMSGADMVIHHCPGCGAACEPWIKAHREEFDALLAQVID